MEKNKIFTKKGEEILINEEDFDLVSKYSWYVNSNGYAQSRLSRLLSPERKQQQIKMHRLIMNIEECKIQIDHINNNKLDNRRQNLRICNNSQNQANIKAHKRNKVGLKGVRFKDGKYEACIWKNKSIYLGRFDTAEEAAKTYDTKAKELFGEFAKTNY